MSALAGGLSIDAQRRGGQRQLHAPRSRESLDGGQILQHERQFTKFGIRHMRGHSAPEYLQRDRVREAAGERIRQYAGIEAILGGERQRLCDGDEVAGDDELIAQFQGLSRAKLADPRDPLGEGGKQRRSIDRGRPPSRRKR